MGKVVSAAEKVNDPLPKPSPPWQADNSLLAANKELDKHYIPSRYPYAFPQGAPCDYYTAEEAQRAISHTEPILSFCKNLLAD